MFFGPDLFGFLTLHSRDDAGHLGSVLITDSKGIPMEFRYTRPIKPNALQVSLYGTTLLHHVGIELVGRPLIRSVTNKPKLIFVDKPFLLDLANRSQCPVVCVKEIEAEDDSALSDTNGSEYCIEDLLPVDNTFRPLQIVQKKEIQSKTKNLVERLHTEFDVLAPFDRMKRAVETILR